MRRPLLALLVTLFTVAAKAQSVPEPVREYRGTWVAVVYNIDWPSRPGMSAAAQKAELRKLLDRVARLNLNAVVLQARPASDTIYPSKEPYCRWLSGKMGKSPGYDALAFAISEAHARGLELHAWCNPFRALASNKESATSSHISKKRPNWIRKYENKVWLDPGLPDVQSYALSEILGLVQKYDLDGIHIDDYFYPYPKNPKVRPIPQFPDSSTHARYGKGVERNEWRRQNMNLFVSKLYSGVKRRKGWVKVGISPFGIWRPGYPRGIKADLDAYDMIYADSRRWLKSGWCDYLTPQLYWRISPRDQSYSALAQWWLAESGGKRHVWPGMATSRIASSADRGRPASEIANQVKVTRSSGGTGHCHWSAKALMTNRKGIADLLRKNYYQDKAVIPASPWLGRGKPAHPRLSGQRTAGGVTVSWKGDRKARWWIVQVQDTPQSRWRTERQLWGKTTRYTAGNAFAVAVRALDPFGNLSEPAVFR